MLLQKDTSIRYGRLRYCWHVRPRSALGQFLSPMSFEHGWGREAFSFAIALQNLIWGAVQPFAGAIADRFGPVRVLSAGAMLYALGLVGMATAQSPLMLDLSAGVDVEIKLSQA